MTHRNGLTIGLGTAVLALAAVSSGARAEDKPKAPGNAAPPAIEGKWTGTWGVFSPIKQGEAPTPYPRAQMKLDCTVEVKDGKFQATFEGECGRPYKYTIKMEGRPASKSVLFKGTADLGPMDGGVYDWIGRANEKEFVGFYTSSGYVGSFTLARPKPETPAAAN